MAKMADIIKNKETFRKFKHFQCSPRAEERNLKGFSSVSPKAEFFRERMQRQDSSKKSLNFEKRLRDHRSII